MGDSPVFGIGITRFELAKLQAGNDRGDAVLSLEEPMIADFAEYL